MREPQFLHPSDHESAEASFYSDDESVRVDLHAMIRGDHRSYTCLVYARYEWQRVGDATVRTLLYEYRPEAVRGGLTWAQAEQYAKSLTREPEGI